jgi:hypothetical protein
MATCLPLAAVGVPTEGDKNASDVTVFAACRSSPVRGPLMLDTRISMLFLSSTVEGTYKIGMLVLGRGRFEFRGCPYRMINPRL